MQLNTAALAMHLTKSYPEHFKGSLQRLKKLEQGQLLRIVAERAVTEGLVDIAAEADWRTSSQRLTKADVTLSQ